MNSPENIDRFMKQLAAAEADAAVPNASAVWWRAELRRRLALEERATRPMRIADRVACALFTAAAMALAAQLGTLQVFLR